MQAALQNIKTGHIGRTSQYWKAQRFSLTHRLQPQALHWPRELHGPVRWQCSQQLLAFPATITCLKRNVRQPATPKFWEWTKDSQHVKWTQLFTKVFYTFYWSQWPRKKFFIRCQPYVTVYDVFGSGNSLDCNFAVFLYVISGYVISRHNKLLDVFRAWNQSIKRFFAEDVVRDVQQLVLREKHKRSINNQGRTEVRGQESQFGAPWDKKQVWRPHVRALGLSEANILHWRKCLWHCWDFPTPLQSFGATIVIQHPGNCAPLAPRYAPANKTRLVRYLVHRVRWSLFQLLYVVLLPISLNPVKVCNCTRYKFLHTISSRLLLVFLRCCTFESSTWRAKLTSFRQPPVPRLSWNKQNK